MKTDKDLVCIGGKYNDGCRQGFVFTVGEQEFLEGLYRDGKVSEMSQPKYCPDCRARRKEKKSRNTH